MLPDNLKQPVAQAIHLIVHGTESECSMFCQPVVKTMTYEYLQQFYSKAEIPIPL